MPRIANHNCIADVGPRGSRSRCAPVTGSRPDVPPDLLASAQQYLASRQAGRRAIAPDVDQAWAEFYRFCAPLLRKFVSACRVPPAERDDCIQNVWAELIDKLPAFRFDPARGRFREWLFTLVHSESVDLAQRRALRRHEQLSERDATIPFTPSWQSGCDLPESIDAVGVEVGQEVDVDKAIVRSLLNVLRDEGRESDCRLMEMRWLHGCSTREIAQGAGLDGGAGLDASPSRQITNAPGVAAIGGKRSTAGDAARGTWSERHQFSGFLVTGLAEPCGVTVGRLPLRRARAVSVHL